MAVFTPANIRSLWLQEGGDPSKADIATAVAMAESGGRTDATHANTDGTIDRGLWQINSIHGDQSTLDPTGNAKAAIAISKNGTDWSPWTTFNNGAFRRFMGHTQGTTDAQIVHSVTPLKIIGQVAAALVNPNTYFRLGKGALGGTLLILGTGGLVFIVANKASGGQLGQSAKKAAVLAAAE